MVDQPYVNINTVNPGTDAASLGKAEDAAHASGDVGVMALSVRKNSAAAVSGSDGDYQPLITDTNGRLHANVVAASGAIASGAVASGAVASGAVAAGAIAAGALATGAIADMNAASTARGTATLVLPVQVVSASGYVPAYESGGAAITIDYAHHEIHEGAHYIASRAVDIAASGTIFAAIVTPNTAVAPHMTFNVISEAEAQYLIYENGTAASNGTAVDAICRNRRNVGTATVNVYHTPTSPDVSAATLLQTKHWGNGKTQGADVRGASEFILKQAGTYIFQIENATSSVNYTTWWLDWYED